MFQRKKLVTAIAFTIIVTVVVAASSEGLRQYMQFNWQIEEGDRFLYDVSVTGYYRVGSSSLPLPLAPLNNTQVLVEIVSLVNISQAGMFFKYNDDFNGIKEFIEIGNKRIFIKEIFQDIQYRTLRAIFKNKLDLQSFNEILSKL